MMSHCFIQVCKVLAALPECLVTTTEDDDKTATAMISSSSSSTKGKEAEEGKPDDDDAELLLERRRRWQDDAGQLVSHAQLRDRLERALPLEHVVRVFGYGSGVFDQTLRRHSSSDINRPKETKEVQAGRDVDDDGDAAADDENDDDSAPLVDLIVVVNDAAQFHRQNVQMNPGHYPIWRRNAGPDSTADRAARIQRHAVPTFWQSYVTNPGAYYVIDNDTHKIKYGVVHGDDLKDDLCDWKYLYLAGRLHKPTVNVYTTPEAAAVEQAQLERNLPSALHTALLILSGTTNNKGSAEVDELHVYETIAGLSYSGDFRMRFGAEDPNKIRNLVASAGSRARFRHLYRSAAQQLERQGIVSIHPHAHASSNGTWTWDASASALRALAEPLPARLQRAVAGSAEEPGSSSALMAAAAPESMSLRVQNELHRIVAPAARYQSVKGLVTAGSIRTSITYALRKLRKGILKGR
jgi:mitochondrial translocator assembly and maintenance protein 41